MRIAAGVFTLLALAAPGLLACKPHHAKQPDELAEARLERSLPRAKGHIGELGVLDHRLLLLSAAPDLVRDYVNNACRIPPKDPLVTAKQLAVNFEDKIGVPTVVVCSGDVSDGSDSDWKAVDPKPCGDAMMACDTAKALARSAAWLRLNQSLAAHSQTVIAFIKTYSRNGGAAQ